MNIYIWIKTNNVEAYYGSKPEGSELEELVQSSPCT